MTHTYAPLVRLATRHAYFGAAGPLVWEPLPETDRRLRDVAAISRTVGSDYVVAVPTDLSDPTDPDSTPVFARRPVRDVFRFALRATDASVAAVTEAAGWRPGASVFVLDNLRDDADGDEAVLGDGPDRWGTPVPLITGRTLPVALDPPVGRARVRLFDRDGVRLLLHRESEREAVAAIEVPLDVLTGPGLYTAEVVGQGTVRFVFAPSLRGRAPLAFAEVFAEPPRGGSLPASSRIVDGEAPLGRRLRAELPARSTRWRYVVVKSSGAAGAPLGDYVVEPIEPAGPAVDEGDPGVFTTRDAVAWRHAPAVFQLARGSPNATPLYPLPTPGPGAVLVPDPSGALTALFIYV